jgi:hypothetical protein
LCYTDSVLFLVADTKLNYLNSYRLSSRLKISVYTCFRFAEYLSEKVTTVDFLNLKPDMLKMPCSEATHTL